MDAEVVTTSCDHFYYNYSSTSVIRPNDLTAFTANGLPRLTLQTCSGAWFENRQMFEFSLARVNAPAATAAEHQAARDAIIQNLQSLIPN
jgi:sortase (surface protein transpeptidase)